MDQRAFDEKVLVDGVTREEVDKLKYESVMMSASGRMGEEINHRLLEGRKVFGSLGIL